MRNGYISDGAPFTTGKRPTADDFKSEAVQRAVLSKTIQHPVTLFPAASGVLGVAGSAVIGSPVGLAVALGLVFVGTASWFWNYFVRGPTLAEQHIKSLQDLRERFDNAEIEQIEVSLESAGFEDGAKEARELQAAYQRLLGAISQHFAEDDLNGQRFRALAKDTYRQGVSILRRALGAYQALADVDLKKLEKELRDWQKQVAKSDEGSTWSDTLKRQITSHQRRIESFHAREEQLRTLIVEADALEAVLESSSQQIFDLVGRDVSTLFNSDGSATRLERAIEAARLVEERLNGWENPSQREMDLKYRQLGEDSSSIEDRRK